MNKKDKERKKAWADKVKIAKDCFLRSKNNPQFASLFYHNLFFLNKDLRKYFLNTKWEHQEKALMHGLDHLTNFLDEKSDFSRNQISRLSQLHSKKNLNIHPHDYYYWLDALILTFRETDPHWIDNDSYYVREVFFYPISFMISMYLMD